jgi:hypothetical protein
MTDRQEIRAKSLEMAVRLLGPTETFDVKRIATMKEDDLWLVLKGFNLCTNIFEKIIFGDTDQQDD